MERHGTVGWASFPCSGGSPITGCICCAAMGAGHDAGPAAPRPDRYPVRVLVAVPTAHRLCPAATAFAGPSDAVLHVSALACRAGAIFLQRTGIVDQRTGPDRGDGGRSESGDRADTISG